MAKSEGTKRGFPPIDTPARLLNRVHVMDDTQWLPGDRGHLHTLTRGMERAGRLTNVHSDPTKTVLVGTEIRDGRFHVLADTVYLNAGGGEYAIRIFPHFPHFFSHFLGKSLSVMFKRKHSSGIVW